MSSSADTTCDQAEMSRLRASMLQDLRERLLDLRMFNSLEEINHHCQDQDSLIILTAESDIKGIVQIQDEFLAKISEYRSRLIGRKASLFSTNSVCRTSVEMSNLQARVRELTEEIERFKSQHLEVAIGTLEEAQSKTNELREALRKLKREMNRDAFGGEFMTFRVNNLCHLERLRYFGSFVTKNKPFEQEKPKPKKTLTTVIRQEPLRSFKSSDGLLFGAMFHTGGFLLISFEDGPLRVWNEEFQETKVITKGLDAVPLSSVSVFLELPNKFIFTGHRDGLITMWDEDLSPRSVFVGHTAVITSFKLLKNGNFASLSNDLSLKIWTFQLAERIEPRLSFTFPTTRRVLSQIGVLSNGFLVTVSCTIEPTENDFLTIWDADRGILVESFLVPLEMITSCIVLPNDDLVFSEVTGYHHIFNLTSKSFLKKIEHPRQDVYRLYNLSNGYILATSFDDSSYIQVWNAEFNRIYQDFATGHTDGIWSCYVSSDGKTLVTKSHDYTLKMWSLTTD